jgi:hypothetical protein
MNEATQPDLNTVAFISGRSHTGVITLPIILNITKITKEGMKQLSDAGRRSEILGGL